MDHRHDSGAAPATGSASSDQDDRLGEAIETYLALAEQGAAPDPESFAARYPEFGEDIRAALEGLELVNGLVGHASGYGSGSSPGGRHGGSLESGRRIAGYRVVRELGRGGMGTVYEAVHVGLDRPVALKVLGIHAAPDSSARRRFMNEARTAAGLHHTHIVPVFDVGQAGALCYYAMQRIEGSGLDRVIRHLRRTRTTSSGGSSSSGTSGSLPTGREPASSSHFNSNVSRLWVRVSANLPWRRTRHIRAAEIDGGDGDFPTKAIEKGGGEVGLLDTPPRLLSPPPGPTSLGDDTTGSWASRSRKGETSQHPEGLAGSVASSVLTAAGTSLGGRQQDDEALPPLEPPRGSAYFRWVAEVGLQSAEALAHAHHHGVIHRDVKPSNLLIDHQGTIWVTDFGLARRLADPGLTQHDNLLGTPRYMSPEQARTGVIDGRTDVYSLGATLFELLTLRPPFDGASAAELVEQIGGKEPVAPRLINRRVPRDLETIVLKSLSKRPADRYPSAMALAEDLARFLNHEPVRARRISPVGRFVRVARRHPGITTVTAVASALVLGIATYAYVRILKEKNDAITASLQAIKASDEKNAALHEKEEEAEKARAAARWALSANATNLLLSEMPDRRAKGLDLLEKIADPEKAVRLDEDPALSPSRLRDQAVEFLVLRDVQSRPDFPTGPTRGIEFGPGGTVLAAVSEDGRELSLWNVDSRQRFEAIMLSDGVRPSAPLSAVATPAPRSDTGAQAEPARTGTTSSHGGASPAPPNGSRGGGGFWADRLAQAGHILAVVRPDDGLRLFDVRTGSPLHELRRPGRQVLSLMGNPASERLLTIESALPRNRFTPPGEPPSRRDEIELRRDEVEVVLWDLNRLEEQPIVLERNRFDFQHRNFTFAAFSPDGRTVAIAANRSSSAMATPGTVTVAFYSATDGKSAELPIIDTQAETLNAIALGAGNVLATASGNSIQFWDREAGTFLSSLSSMNGNPRLMRFNPQGTLLAAVVGGNHAEVWDTVSHKLLASLPAAQWITDISFTPDGRCLAVGGVSASTSVWCVSDSAARVQLGGLPSRPTSLAFSPTGCLAIGGINGEVWLYRDGGNRCTSPASASASATEPGSRNPERDRERERSRRTSVMYDAGGRLIAHDSRELRIWQDGSSLAQPPAVVRVPIIEPGMWGSQPLARSADGQTMVLARSSEILVWQAAHPDRIRRVIAPPRAPGEDLLPSPPNPPEPMRANLGRGLGGRTEGRGRTGMPNRNGPFGREPYAVQLGPKGDRIYMLGGISRLSIWSFDPADEIGPIRAQRIEPPTGLPVG